MGGAIRKMGCRGSRRPKRFKNPKLSRQCLPIFTSKFSLSLSLSLSRDRSMADIEPPSFSLGLELDFDPDPRIPAPGQSEERHSTLNPAPGPSCSTPLDDADDEEEEEEKWDELAGGVVMDSETEESPKSRPDPPRALKRLRRVPASLEPRAKKVGQQPVCRDSGDEEIEQFSSQEEFVADARPSTQLDSVCSSSSKVPLRGCGVFTTQASIQGKAKSKKVAPKPTASPSLEMGRSGFMFPKLTISPLRRFQLIDSDSEEPSSTEDVSRKAQKNESSSKVLHSTEREPSRKLSAEKDQKAYEKPETDLWKDFHPIKSFHISTPVLDEVCEEYFQSARDKKASAQKVGRSQHASRSIDYRQDANNAPDIEQCWNLADPLPPAHHYFFHDDPRIQKLVRSRLPNFAPLGIVYSSGNRQPSGSVIDYMSQYNAKASKREGNQRDNGKKVTRRVRNKSNKSNASEVSHSAEGWVDPKRSAAIPKNAGKRRITANGQDAGHWYTSPEGRKVYVSRNGQEFTGQIAYRQYRRESGGFSRSKKKTDSKRKKG